MLINSLVGYRNDNFSSIIPHYLVCNNIKAASSICQRWFPTNAQQYTGLIGWCYGNVKILWSTGPTLFKTTIFIIGIPAIYIMVYIYTFTALSF